MSELTIYQLLDLEKTIASRLFVKYAYPWEVLPHISEYIMEIGPHLDSSYKLIADNVWASDSAVISPTASITGPCIIDHGAEIRHCAFIRGSAIIGKKSVIGNSTEVKNSIVFDNVQAPHFNYVGDSILGYKAHLGAGAVTSNIKSDRTNVTILMQDKSRLETGLRKFGAIVGDFTEIGCNSVLNPGCVIGRNVTVYPTSCVRGYIPSGCIFKTGGVVVAKY